MNYNNNNNNSSNAGSSSGQQSTDWTCSTGCEMREVTNINSSSSTQEQNQIRNVNHPIVVHSSKPLHSRLNAPLVFTWGRGEDGQLGLGDTSDMYEPTFVDSLRGVHVKQLACGSGHTCILTEEGEVYSVGRGDDGRLGHNDNSWKYIPRLVNALMGKVVSLVTCGSYHTAAVTNGGELYTWGGGMYGKLGHGDESGCSLPRKVETGLTNIHVVNVACGSRHTACLSNEGKLYSWGDKENGVAGHGDIEGHQYTPKLVEKLAHKVVTQLSACGFHTGVITQDNQVYHWGEGKFGRLGLSSERNCHSPKLVEEFCRLQTRPKQIACGGFHTAVVTEDNCLYTYGGGEHGQLGLSDKFNRLVPTLVTAFDTEKVTMVSCGWSHTVVLTSKGISTFGNGEHGKLGHGSVKKLCSPQLVKTLNSDDYKVLSIASYNEHTAALVEPISDQDTTGVFGTNTVTVSASYMRQMSDLINQRDYADIVFRVDGDLVYAHRSILASRCDHFATMFASGFRESTEKEILIPNVSRMVFLRLMEYIYTDSVVIDPDFAVELYILADMYGIHRLKSLCVTVVKRNLTILNATMILQQASDENCQQLKSIAMDFVIENFERISKSDCIRALSHEVLLEILSRR